MEGLPEINDLVARSKQVYEVLLTKAISQFVADFKLAAEVAVQEGKFKCTVFLQDRFAIKPVFDHLYKELRIKGYTTEQSLCEKSITIRWEKEIDAAYLFLPRLIPIVVEK